MRSSFLSSVQEMEIDAKEAHSKLGLTCSTEHQNDLQHKETVTARIKPNNLTASENM
jgi:hypothetical protein